MLGHNISPDDICNPYLTDYALSPKAPGEPCQDVDNCSIIDRLDLNNAFIRKPPFNYLFAHYAAVATPEPLSGTETVTINPNNLFERTLLTSLGLDPYTTSTLGYTWTSNNLVSDPLVMTFTNGTKLVTISVNYSVPRYLYENSLGLLTEASLSSLPLAQQEIPETTIVSYYNNYAAACSCDHGGYIDLVCNSEGTPDTLAILGRFVYKGSYTSPGTSIVPTYVYSAFASLIDMRITGLDLSSFRQDTADHSLPCIHTCIACNELKAAYKVYKTEVADAYGIKGKGHPFYETSVRSFFNYYFRNRHYSDEYLNFMKGCSLSDSLFLPEYYGYFQASGTTTEIGHILDTIRGYRAISPAVAPLAGPEPGSLNGLSNIKYLRYKDAGDVEHLYVDFTSVFTNERLRPFIQFLTTWLGANAGSATWSFNKLNSEVSGQPAYAAEVFLPGTGTALTSTLAAAGVTVTSENVTLKDGAHGAGNPVMEIPFTHHHFELSTASTLDIALRWGQLQNEITTVLQGRRWLITMWSSLRMKAIVPHMAIPCPIRSLTSVMYTAFPTVPATTISWPTLPHRWLRPRSTQPVG